MSPHPRPCPTCGGRRLQLGGWMGPTPIRRYPDPCPDCSPELAGRELQATYVAWVTEPGRFDAEGQAKMLLEPKPPPVVGMPTGEKRHGVYCRECDWRVTYIVLEGGVAACDSCGGIVTLRELGAIV